MKNDFHYCTIMYTNEFNGDLKTALEREFKPLGIVAYSGCCRWGCTGSYGGDGQSPEDFVSRDHGIYYIRFTLDGMNYNDSVTSCYASYCAPDGVDTYQYLVDNWDAESKILHRFCRVLGLSPDEYTLSLPDSINTKIGIHFTKPYLLQPSPPDPGTSDEESIH